MPGPVSDTRYVSLRIATGVVAVILAATPLLGSRSVPATGPVANDSIATTAGPDGSGPQLPLSGSLRIALYGDSLVSETAQDFAYLATLAGASVHVHTYPGTSPCNFFASMMVEAQEWRPTVAMLLFTGDAFTSCMDGLQLGTPAYFTRYEDDTQAAITIFRSVGSMVVLVGLPADASPTLTQNALALNGIYQSLAEADPGVSYDDAGQAVMATGRFTWALPCLSTEPCTGPDSTNIVRAPDGVHFCPNGETTLVAGLEECDVYSSGAFRFASAMLDGALRPWDFSGMVGKEQERS
jgi:hypothetical protein